MEKDLSDNLFALCKAYGASKNLEQTTIGKRCAGDQRFFQRIAEGKTYTVRKYDRVVRWFDKNWPDGLPWPDDIERPEADDG